MTLGAAVRHLWPLDPEAAFLNHGSYGATPRAVLAEQDRWRARLEAQPVDFLVRRYPDEVAAARAAVASFLGADPERLVLVPNATTGVATVLAAVVRPGERVVVTDHVYPAVVHALDARGADVATVAYDLDADASVLLDAVDERVRLVIVDVVTSGTALRMPYEEVVRGCRERGVPCLVDAAHAPGLLPVDLRALDPDFWTGNLHKWVGAPKGAAVLYAREPLRPLVPSHGWGLGFQAEFDWAGTFDPSAWLSVPAALAFMDALGWDAVRAYGRELARDGAAASGLPAPAPPERHEAMVVLDAGLPSWDAANALRDALWASDRVEVGAAPWRGRGWLRISAAPYNVIEDYERLGAALARMRP